jgi:hypothetical protein
MYAPSRSLCGWPHGDVDTRQGYIGVHACSIYIALCDGSQTSRSCSRSCSRSPHAHPTLASLLRHTEGLNSEINGSCTKEFHVYPHIEMIQWNCTRNFFDNSHALHIEKEYPCADHIILPRKIFTVLQGSMGLLTNVPSLPPPLRV